MSVLPYVTAPSHIEKALLGIKAAATPETVSQDFVKTILKIPGGSGNQMTSFLKKIGFATKDGTPTDIYKRFRNSDTKVSGNAMAEALKIGYQSLYIRNEYMHQLSDSQLRGLVIEETGQGDDSSVVSYVLLSIKHLKKFADWSKKESSDESLKPVTTKNVVASSEGTPQTPSNSGHVGLNLSYTINLNLPATSDVAVFSAIFKALKDNMLRSSNEQG